MTTQPSKDTEQRTLDDILSQAFTDGASDTMWQNDRHVEIFAKAKKEIEALIHQTNIKAKIDELEMWQQKMLAVNAKLGKGGYIQVRLAILKSELKDSGVDNEQD